MPTSSSRNPTKEIIPLIQRRFDLTTPIQSSSDRSHPRSKKPGILGSIPNVTDLRCKQEGGGKLCKRTKAARNPEPQYRTDSDLGRQCRTPSVRRCHQLGGLHVQP
ncbi:hypothetical protein M8818_001841 [Zalaria obscura]|uniref:Uncharacterized protein n=1 Tax=Zalaria obscura TaxID=2024903 RepID=A0ACC3SJH4_9PEZI